MIVTSVDVKLARGQGGGKPLSYVHVVFDDCFVVHDLRIIDGSAGPFVAMPSRHYMDACHDCGWRNATVSRYCNGCGVRLADGRVWRGLDGRARVHLDVAHPVTNECRIMIHEAVMAAWRKEKDFPGLDAGEVRSEEPEEKWFEAEERS